MASLPYASGSGFVDWRVLRRPCCTFGRCNGLEIEGMTPLKMGRCSDGVAMGLRQMKE